MAKYKLRKKGVYEMENNVLTAEQLFRNIREIKLEIMRLEQREAYIRSSMLPGAIRYDKDNVISSPEDPMGRYMERLSDLEERTRDRLNRLLDCNLAAEKILANMPTAKYRLLLDLRYIEGGLRHRNSWSEVAMIMNYDERYLRGELRQEAIREAQEVYDRLKEEMKLTEIYN